VMRGGRARAEQHGGRPRGSRFEQEREEAEPVGALAIQWGRPSQLGVEDLGL
jgi:hypothetical protein